MKKIFTLLLSTVLVHSANAQLQNNTLENWRTISSGSATNIEAPNDWYGIDSLLYSFAASSPFITAKRLMFKDNNAHGGSFAARLLTQDIGGGFVAPGVLVNANPDATNFDPLDPIGSLAYQGGTPVTQRINTLTAWVRYIPVGGDYASVNIQAIKNISGKDSVVGKGSIFVSSLATYSQVTVPVSYVDATVVPDKVIIICTSSDISGISGGTPADGSELFVDDINISTALGIADIYSNATLGSVFPNPANNILNIKAEGNNKLSYRVYSVTGSLIAASSFEKETTISLDRLSPGSYYYEILDAQNKKAQRGQFVVTK